MLDPAAADANEARRRKLDALFAEQPYLSPTMRAWLVSSDDDTPGGVAIAAPAADAERVAERRLALHTVSPRNSRAVSASPKRRRRQGDSPTVRVPARAGGDVVRLELSIRPSAPWSGVDTGSLTGTLWTAREAADYLRVAPDTVRRWVREGRLAAARAGRLLRFRRADVDAVLTPTRPQISPRV